ncbi:hypothetical protein GSbR_17810 [Geobacter sp. SVR]|nr:hypothetical protein GSVR_33070 [Geobacter sp. SVR]GCF85181.1 hypothetical protein GSbR_17810 [Geobacter sp. SVR]
MEVVALSETLKLFTNYDFIGVTECEVNTQSSVVKCVPKCRQKVLYDRLCQHLGELLKDPAKQQGCQILERHLRPNHVHILISISPKVSVSQVIGFIKGKSAIAIARTYVGRRKNFAGQSFWARGYYVSR